jgi:hypothetical protein
MPPIYVPPGEPGPTRGSGTLSSPPKAKVKLLYSQGTASYGYSFGWVDEHYGFSSKIQKDLNAEITSVKIKVGTFEYPEDEILMFIDQVDAYGDFMLQVDGGVSDIVSGSSLPLWTINAPFVEFKFPDKPQLVSGRYYAIRVIRTGEVPPFDYYLATYDVNSEIDIYVIDINGGYTSDFGGMMLMQVYGKLL